MPSEVVAHYRELIERAPGADAGMCWAVVRSPTVAVTIENVARRLGADPEELEVLDLSDAVGGAPHDGSVLLLDQTGSAVTIYEVNGFQCARPQLLSTLSVDGEVCSAYWNVELDNRLSLAIDGEVVTTLDGMAPDRREGSDPDALLDVLDSLYEALADPSLDFRAGMLALIERRTGVRLNLDWFSRPHEAITITVLPP